jgi:hypothetical protein
MIDFNKWDKLDSSNDFYKYFENELINLKYDISYQTNVIILLTNKSNYLKNKKIEINLGYKYSFIRRFNNSFIITSSNYFISSNYITDHYYNFNEKKIVYFDKNKKYIK